MRRKNKEITQKTEIEAVIRKSIVCRLAMSDNDIPYIVPLCFGYQDNTLYVHGALKGQKINILKKNQNVCFEFDINSEIVENEAPCDWGMKYQSVIGFGKASFIDDQEQKQKAVDIIMGQYSEKTFQFPQKTLDGTAVIRIDITSMTGKQSGFKEGIDD